MFWSLCSSGMKHLLYTGGFSLHYKVRLPGSPTIPTAPATVALLAPNRSGRDDRGTLDSALLSQALQTA